MLKQLPVGAASRDEDRTRGMLVWSLASLPPATLRLPRSRTEAFFAGRYDATQRGARRQQGLPPVLLSK